MVNSKLIEVGLKCGTISEHAIQLLIVSRKFLWFLLHTLILLLCVCIQVSHAIPFWGNENSIAGLLRIYLFNVSI